MTFGYRTVTDHLLPSDLQAGISEHAVMYPVDSIKVSYFFFFVQRHLKVLIYSRLGCKFFPRRLWQFTRESGMHSVEFPRRRASERFGEEFPLLSSEQARLMLYTSAH